MSKESIRVFAPATVANLGSGFDVMGLAINQVADEVIVSKSDHKSLVIEEIEGDLDQLPKSINDNTCTVAIRSLLNRLNSQQGFQIKIRKHIAINSGLGSSASSAVAGAFAANELLGNPFTREQLIPFALDGEYVASKGFHADNIAPCMLGGITFVREMNPLHIENLTFDNNIILVVLYQYVKVSTAEARNILPQTYDRNTLVRQSSRLASLVYGFVHKSESHLRFGLEDELATPYRKHLIPHFAALRDAALDNGAWGFNISGSGPSVFACCKDESIAKAIEVRWQELMQEEKKPFEIYSSKINETGVRVAD